MKTQKNRQIAVIGAGAAGFFTAVNAARLNPRLNITIYEKSRKVLSKVRISGGGRCNVTHHCFDPEQLALAYPRGGKMLRWSFEQFQAKDTVQWFEERGVELKTEEDGRMFPVTDDSRTIINCLLNEAQKYGVTVRTQTPVEKVEPLSNGRFNIFISGDKPHQTDAVVVATGGSSRIKSYQWLEELGHTVYPPVPSLFTFNFRNKIFSDLAGISVENARVQIKGTSFSETGPVLITHWGLSGPAILKLSAWAARELYKKEYRYDIEVNWLHPANEEDLRILLLLLRNENAKKQVNKQSRFNFPNRLWLRFLELAEINPQKRWAEISNAEIHHLTRELVAGSYNIQGKTTYKEEFVTCGGIKLDEINPDTLESKKIPKLYFAGEVLDIDGITGGFNFQAAWTNGWLAAQAIAAN